MYIYLCVCICKCIYLYIFFYIADHLNCEQVCNKERNINICILRYLLAASHVDWRTDARILSHRGSS